MGGGAGAVGELQRRVAVELVGCRGLVDKGLAIALVHAELRLMATEDESKIDASQSRVRSTRPVPRNPSVAPGSLRRQRRQGTCNPIFSVYKKEMFELEQQSALKPTFRWSDAADGEVGGTILEMAVWGTRLDAPPSPKDPAMAKRFHQLEKLKGGKSKRRKFLGRVRIRLTPLLEERLEVVPASVANDRSRATESIASARSEGNTTRQPYSGRSDTSFAPSEASTWNVLQNGSSARSPKGNAVSNLTGVAALSDDTETVWIELQRRTRRSTVSGYIGVRISVASCAGDNDESGLCAGSNRATHSSRSVLPTPALSTRRSLASSIGGGSQTERRLFHDRHLFVFIDRASVRVSSQNGDSPFEFAVENVRHLLRWIAGDAVDGDDSGDNCDESRYATSPPRLYTFLRLDESCGRTKTVSATEVPNSRRGASEPEASMTSDKAPLEMPGARETDHLNSSPTQASQAQKCPEPPDYETATSTIPHNIESEALPSPQVQALKSSGRSNLSSVRDATTAQTTNVAVDGLKKLRDIMTGAQKPKAADAVWRSTWSEAFVLKAGANSHASCLSLALFDAASVPVSSQNAEDEAQGKHRNIPLQRKSGRSSSTESMDTTALKNLEEGEESSSLGMPRRRLPPQHHCVGHVHIPLSWLDADPSTRFKRNLYSGLSPEELQRLNEQCLNRNEESRAFLLKARVQRCSRWVRLDVPQRFLNSLPGIRKPKLAVWLKVSAFFGTKNDAIDAAQLVSASGFTAPVGGAVAIEEQMRVLRVSVLEAKLLEARKSSHSTDDSTQPDSDNASGSDTPQSALKSRSERSIVVESNKAPQTRFKEGTGLSTDGWGIEFLRRAAARRREAKPFADMAVKDFAPPDPVAVFTLSGTASCGAFGYGVARGSHCVIGGGIRLPLGSDPNTSIPPSVQNANAPRTYVAQATWRPFWRSNLAVLLPKAESFKDGGASAYIHVLDAAQVLVPEKDQHRAASAESSEDLLCDEMLTVQAASPASLIENPSFEDIPELSTEEEFPFMPFVDPSPRQPHGFACLPPACAKQVDLRPPPPAVLAVARMRLSDVPSQQDGGQSVSYRWLDSIDGRSRVKIAAWWEDPSPSPNDGSGQVLGVGNVLISQVVITEQRLVACRRPVFCVVHCGDIWAQTLDAEVSSSVLAAKPPVTTPLTTARERLQTMDPVSSNEKGFFHRIVVAWKNFVEWILQQLEMVWASLEIPKYTPPIAATVATYVGARIRAAAGAVTHRRLVRVRLEDGRKKCIHRERTSLPQCSCYRIHCAPGGWNWAVTDPGEAVNVAVFERRSRRSPLLLGTVRIQVSTIGKSGEVHGSFPLHVEAEGGRRISVGHVQLRVNIKWQVKPYELWLRYLRPPNGSLGHAPIGLGERPAVGSAPCLSWMERCELRRLHANALAATIARSARYLPGIAEILTMNDPKIGMLLPEVVTACIGPEAASFSLRQIRLHANRLSNAFTGGISALVARLPPLRLSAIVGWEDWRVSSGVCLGWVFFCLNAQRLIGLAGLLGTVTSALALAYTRPISWISCKRAEEEGDVRNATRAGLAAAWRGAASARRALRRKHAELIRIAICVQHAMREVAIWAERLRALFCWADRRASSLFFALVALGSAAAIFVPLRWIGVFIGLFLMRPPCLRVYGRPPPPLCILLRLPCLETSII